MQALLPQLEPSYQRGSINTVHAASTMFAYLLQHWLRPGPCEHFNIPCCAKHLAYAAPVTLGATTVSTMEKRCVTSLQYCLAATRLLRNCAPQHNNPASTESLLRSVLRVIVSKAHVPKPMRRRRRLPLRPVPPDLLQILLPKLLLLLLMAATAGCCHCSSRSL
jgi:hypothetical protein